MFAIGSVRFGIFSQLWNCLFLPEFCSTSQNLQIKAEMLISKWENRGTSGSLNYLLHPFSACLMARPSDIGLECPSTPRWWVVTLSFFFDQLINWITNWNIFVDSPPCETVGWRMWNNISPVNSPPCCSLSDLNFRQKHSEFASNRKCRWHQTGGCLLCLDPLLKHLWLTLSDKTSAVMPVHGHQPAQSSLLMVSAR